MDHDYIYANNAGCNTAQSIRLTETCLDGFLEQIISPKISFRMFSTPQNAGLVLRLMDFYKSSLTDVKIWLANPLRSRELISSVLQVFYWLRQPVPNLGTVGEWFCVRENDRPNLTFQRDHLELGILSEKVHQSFEDHPCAVLLNYCGSNPYFARLLKIINDPRWFFSKRKLYRYLDLGYERMESVLLKPGEDDFDDRCRVTLRAWYDRKESCSLLPKNGLATTSALMQTKTFLSLLMRWWTGTQEIHPELYFYSFDFFGEEIMAEEFRKKVGKQPVRKASGL